MNLPPLVDWRTAHARLAVIFPPGTANRDHSVWEIAAKTIFVMLYIGAVEGVGHWVRPDQVTRMTDGQAERSGEQERLQWAKDSLLAGKGDILGRWYAVNSRESIRDDTIRYSLIENGAVIERGGLATTSPAPRYTLEREFAALFAPELDDATLLARAKIWRDRHMSSGARARIAMNRRGAVAGGSYLQVVFPNGETRRMTPGLSAEISKAVVEDFTRRFLRNPGVVFLSESGNKVVARDDDLARSIGLAIQSDKNLPDIILVDLGPIHPLLVFVEVVATDGPINETRKRALLAITDRASFPREHVAFVTAFLDRSAGPFKKTVSSLAWGSYAWFASEPDKLALFSDQPHWLAGRPRF